MWSRKVNMSTPKLNKSLAAMSGTLLFLTAIVIGVSVRKVSADSCVASSTWCCWPPYPATPLYGAAAGQCDQTDCADLKRRCTENSPYAFFTDCTCVKAPE